LDSDDLKGVILPIARLEAIFPELPNGLPPVYGLTTGRQQHCIRGVHRGKRRRIIGVVGLKLARIVSFHNSAKILCLSFAKGKGRDEHKKPGCIFHLDAPYKLNSYRRAEKMTPVAVLRFRRRARS
jgi:hypothetical protein